MQRIITPKIKLNRGKQTSTPLTDHSCNVSSISDGLYLRTGADKNMTHGQTDCITIYSYQFLRGDGGKSTNEMDSLTD